MQRPCRTSRAAANGLIGLAALAGSVLPVGAQAAEEPAGQQVWLDDELAVTYLARVERDWLVVEARHESCKVAPNARSASKLPKLCTEILPENTGRSSRPVADDIQPRSTMGMASAVAAFWSKQLNLAPVSINASPSRFSRVARFTKGQPGQLARGPVARREQPSRANQ